MRRTARLALTVVLVSTCFLQSTPGTAHDHRPPKAKLFVGGASQQGWLIHSGWARRLNARYCLVTFSDGLLRFPPAIKHRLDPSLIPVLRLYKSAPPMEWNVQAWRGFKRGRPVGEAETIPAALVPRSLEGQQQWELQIAPQLSTGHRFMLVQVWWQDEDGCAGSPYPDLGSQSIAWAFHTRVTT